jgi:hypothetical protein
VVAGLVAHLRPAVEAELADPQHLVEEAGKLGSRAELADPQHLVEEAGKLGSQRSEEEAGLAGSVTAVENWTRPSPRCLLEWVSC